MEKYDELYRDQKCIGNMVPTFFRNKTCVQSAWSVLLSKYVTYYVHGPPSVFPYYNLTVTFPLREGIPYPPPWADLWDEH